MMSGPFLLLLLDATSFTLAIVLVALGLVIVFGLMRIINMAHGELFLLGAYTLLVVERLGGSFWIGLLAAPVVVGLVGLVIEEVVIRRIHHRFLDTILATWGLSLVIKQAVVLVFGPQSQTVTPPFTTQLSLLGTSYPAYRLFIMGVAVSVVLLTFRLFLHTRFGLMARAAIADRPMAACLGIDTGRLDRLTFAYGSALAGLAGAVMAPIMSVDPQMGLGVLVPAFLAILTGGAQTLAGTLLGSAMIGGTDVLVASLLPPLAAHVTVLAMAVLVIRLFPHGLYERLRSR
jgi:branched-chain amino acid transport system permease protein/urea transport system permease protein